MKTVLGKTELFGGYIEIKYNSITPKKIILFRKILYFFLFLSIYII